MIDGTELVLPHARQHGLVARQVESELLVYDLDRNVAHVLTPLTEAVWKLCDGKTSVAAILDRLRETSIEPVTTQTVWQALAELGTANLLEEQMSRAPQGHRMTRAELMKKVGMVTVGVPLIASLTVPAALASTSCPGGGCEAGCTVDDDCTSAGNGCTKCAGGPSALGGSCPNHCCAPAGTVVNGQSKCCSGQANGVGRGVTCI